MGGSGWVAGLVTVGDRGWVVVGSGRGWWVMITG